MSTEVVTAPPAVTVTALPEVKPPRMTAWLPLLSVVATVPEAPMVVSTVLVILAEPEPVTEMLDKLLAAVRLA